MKMTCKYIMHYYNLKNKKFNFLAFIKKIMSEYRNNSNNSLNVHENSAGSVRRSRSNSASNARANLNQNSNTLTGFYPPSSFEYYYGDFLTIVRII